jgi:hypothetical protein
VIYPTLDYLQDQTFITITEEERCGSGYPESPVAGRRGRKSAVGVRRRRVHVACYFFGHGDLRLVILDILTRSASHGYELIKEIENLTQGNYTVGVRRRRVHVACYVS